MNKLKLIKFIGINIIISVFIHAEDASKNTGSAIKKGSNSFQFRIFDLNIGAFQGASLSFKKHLTNKFALRTGISLSGSYSEINDTDTRTNSNSYYIDDRTIERDFENKGLRLIFTTQFLNYSDVKNKIHFFYGAGPHFIYYKENLLSKYITEHDESINKSNRDEKFDTFGAGINFILGVEWLVRDNIGLHAEYDSQLSYTRARRSVDVLEEYYSDPDDSIYTRDYSNKSIRFISYTQFGISIYF